MKCSLNLFCDFLEAKSEEARIAVVQRYKRAATEPVKGMNTYYRPAVQLVRGTLRPHLESKDTFQALRDACIRPTWTEKLNDARIQNNSRVYRAVIDALGCREFTVFKNPRMQYFACSDLAVNLQPEVFVRIANSTLMLKLGLCRKSRKLTTVRAILFMLYNASNHEGLSLPIEHVRFLDTMTNQVSYEKSEDQEVKQLISRTAQTFTAAWQTC